MSINEEMGTPINGLRTITQISDMLQEPPARVAYIVRKLRIKQVTRIGIIRLFDEQALSEIKNGLYNMQIRKS